MPPLLLAGLLYLGSGLGLLGLLRAHVAAERPAGIDRSSKKEADFDLLVAR